MQLLPDVLRGRERRAADQQVVLLTGSAVLLLETSEKWAAQYTRPGRQHTVRRTWRERERWEALASRVTYVLSTYLILSSFGCNT